MPSIKKISRNLFIAVAAMSVLVFSGTDFASADRLSPRKLSIADPTPGVTTNHTFDFTITTSAIVGSVVFEYCANDPLFDTACAIPTGLDLSGAVIASQTGETGFTVHGSTTSNRLVITRTPVLAPGGAVSYQFSNVVNPANSSAYYVRLSTHGSDDGTGSRIDEGGLAFSVLTGINTEAYVPPYLLFCAGITVSLDCSSASGSYLNLGELNTSDTLSGTSQYSGATNDESGFTVSIFGITLTSGNQTIPALETPSASQIGASQFGVNLRANTDPSGGEDAVGGGVSAASADYGTPNLFKFKSGDVISSSNLPTDYNRFTVHYIVNISSDQSAGIYTSTFTYIAVASF